MNGPLAYIADGLTGLQIIDVSNAAAPFLVGSVDTPGTARGVDVEGSLAVVAELMPANGIRVINVAQPQTPVIVGNLSITGGPRNVVVRNSIAYVAMNAGGLRLVSLAPPSAPAILGQFTNVLMREVALVGDFAFGTWSPGQGGTIVAINNPATPTLRGFVNLADIAPGGPPFSSGPVAVAADLEFVYLTRSFSSVSEIGTSGVTTLMIGRYQPTYDRAGVAPSTSVVTPQQGQTVTGPHCYYHCRRLRRR